jgi:protein-S-isoprenylcysteine O-methyltransferase Ste14
MITRFVPLAGLILFVLLAVVWRGWLQYRKYGNLGIVLFQSSGWQRTLRDVAFVLVFVAVLLQAAIFAAAPQTYSRLAVMAMPAWTMALGIAMLLASLALIVAAQLNMGASWRIGIDHEASPGLVTSGLYQFCRNPIYVGMIGSLIGITLMLTTWLSLALAAGSIWCIYTQTLEEETYLERTYGAAFRRYAARVGRFLPGIGLIELKSEVA